MLTAMLRAAAGNSTPAPTGSPVWAATNDYPIAVCTAFAFGASGNSAFFCGGAATQGASPIASGYSYNGTSFSAGASIGTGRGAGGSGGTATSGMAASGYLSTGVTGTSQTYNGSAFTTITSVGTSHQYANGAGASASDFLIWGGVGAGFPLTSQRWNGSAWSEAGSIVIANGRRYAQGGGVANDAIVCGGANNTVGNTQTAEKYNGTAWSSITSLPTTMNYGSGVGASSSAFMTAGGNLQSTPPSGYAVNWNASQKWNGTSWSVGPSPRTTIWFPGACGSNTSGIMAGGYYAQSNVSPQVVGSAEKLVLSTAVTSGVFGGSPCCLINRQQTAGFGGNDAGVVATGLTTTSLTVSTTCEKSNGVTWSTTGNITTNTTYSAGAGTATAGVIMTGLVSGTANGVTQTFNGTAWSTGGTTGGPRQRPGGFGASSSACGYVAGFNASSVATSDSYLYNGTSWSTSGSISSTSSNNGGSGTQSAAITSCGANSAGTAQAWAWTFNGSAWSSISSSATTRLMPIVFGGSGLAVTMNGGTPTSGVAVTYAADRWSGSAWSTTGSPIQSRTSQPQGGNYGGTGISGGYTANGATGTTNLYTNTSETYYP